MPLLTPQLSASSIRSIIFRIFASPCPLARRSISVMRKQSFSCRGKSHNGQMNYLTRSIPRIRRERSNRSRFLPARTSFMTHRMSLREITIFCFFARQRVRRSPLNKTLTLTTIRKIANHSENSLKYDSFVHDVIFLFRHAKVELTCLFFEKLCSVSIEKIIIVAYIRL